MPRFPTAFLLQHNVLFSHNLNPTLIPFLQVGSICEDPYLSSGLFLADSLQPNMAQQRSRPLTSGRSFSQSNWPSAAQQTACRRSWSLQSWPPMVSLLCDAPVSKD
jgi:hypothetical protein